MKLLCTIGFAVALAGRAAAQDAAAGKWLMDYPTAIRNENGSEVVLSSRKAIFTLAAQGDSVTGTWQFQADSTGAAPAATGVRGMVTAGKYQLVSDPVERRVNINGDVQSVKMATRYDFSVHGDSLVGTMSIFAVDGSFSGNERDFTATRIRP